MELIPTRPPLEPAQNVNQVDGPPSRGWLQLFDYDVNGNLIYKGSAQSLGRVSQWSVAAAEITDITVAAGIATVTFAAAHGLMALMVLTVVDSQVVGLDGTYTIATVPLGTTLTFGVVGVAPGVYTGAAMKIRTRCPRTNDLVWSIQRLDYNVANQLTSTRYANGTPQQASHAWDSRTTYAYF